MSDANEPNESPEEFPLDPAVTPKVFLKWRAPRFGSANPERMNNPVWEWLIKSRLSAFQASERLDGPSAMDARPGWCFARFGQSATQLPDGREIFIAGEHEDSYDPDFYIYNDVVVQHPDGRLEIFGYPRAMFPPTDFHSATLIGDRVVLIGNLGYPEERHPGQTQVLILDLRTFAIERMKTSGTPPGWIHGHQATCSEDGNSILLRCGKMDRGGEGALIENIDDWRLHLADWQWERLTERRWPRWEVRRKDRERNHLFEYQQAVWEKLIPGLAEGVAERLKGIEIPSLADELGGPPDLELFARRYQPEIAHEKIAASAEEHNVHRIRVEGVVVRYVEDMDNVQMTVEGDLPEQTLKSLTGDFLKKISQLENSPCKLIQL